MSPKGMRPAGREKPSGPCLQLSSVTVDGIVTTDTVASLMTFSKLLGDNAIKSRVACANGDDGARSYNSLANEFYFDRETTHLMLFDPDVSFDPVALLDLLSLDRSFLYLSSPGKQISLRSVYDQLARAREHHAAAVHADADTLGSAGHLGILIVKKSVLEKIVTKAVVQRLQILSDDLDDPFAPPSRRFEYGFFSPCLDSDQGLYRDGVDAFRYRWERQCGGEVFQSDALDIAVRATVRLDVKYLNRELNRVG